MVLELIKARWLEKRPIISFFLGILFTAIGHATSLLLFHPILGIATLFFTAILIMPTIQSLLAREEGMESKSRRSFFHEYRAVFEVYFFFFLGCFLVFLILAASDPGNVYGGQLESTAILKLHAQDAGSLKFPIPDIQPASRPQNTLGGIGAIFANNFYIMLIAFALSIFYGAGSIFLLLYNASIFAYGIVKTVQGYAVSGPGASLLMGVCNFCIFSVHLLPEVASYVLAAMAGGILSEAFRKEKLFSARFWRICQDSLIVLAISASILMIAASTEYLLSNSLISNDTCVSHGLAIVVGWALVLLAAAWFGVSRLRRAH